MGVPNGGMARDIEKRYLIEHYPKGYIVLKDRMRLRVTKRHDIHKMIIKPANQNKLLKYKFYIEIIEPR
jgi:hypothetical protein